MPPEPLLGATASSLVRPGNTTPRGGTVDYQARSHHQSLDGGQVAWLQSNDLWGSTVRWLRRRIPGVKGGRNLGRHFREKLGWAINQLHQLNEATEGDFLHLCEQVQEFFTSAQAMTDQGAQVVELVSGQAMSETTQRLQRLVDETKLRFKTSQAGFSESLMILAAVRQEAATAFRPLGGFQQIVMGLRVLGISTRMESARLQGQDEGFQFLAEEVSRLTDTIQAQTGGIASQLRSLTASLDETLGSMGGLGASLDADVGNLLNVVGESLGDLRKRRSNSELAAARMAAHAREVHGNIAEVVSSLQFHDITRQRLEHVQEAFSALIEGKHNASPADACELQTALLAHAVHELDQAAKTMQTSLRGIAGSVREVAHEARLLMQGEDPQELSFMEQLGADLSRIMDIASQMEKAISHLQSLVEAVVRTLEEVGSSLRSIDNISYSIKLIALNAAIKSARLGGHGSALESLAQAIQRLSVEAQAATQALGGVLENMGQSAQSLRRAMEFDAGDGTQTVQELRAVLDSIRSGSVACDNLLGKLEHHGRDLANQLETEAADIMFHLRIQEGVSEVIDYLEDILGRQGANKHPKHLSEAGSTVVMAQRYTMASERQIHQAWSVGVGSSSVAGPASTEVFDSGPTELPAGAAPQEQLELGDNVELF